MSSFLLPLLLLYPPPPLLLAVLLAAVLVLLVVVDFVRWKWLSDDVVMSEFISVDVEDLEEERLSHCFFGDEGGGGGEV